MLLDGWPGFNAVQRQKDFSLPYGVYSVSEAHEPPIQWIAWDLLPAAKQSRRAADHVFPSNAEIKTGESIHPLSHTSGSWCGTKLIKHRDKFTFLPCQR
jgi:hypothetical protein